MVEKPDTAKLFGIKAEVGRRITPVITPIIATIINLQLSLRVGDAR